jgi:fatty acid desaturase
MSHDHPAAGLAATARPPAKLDYSLTGENAARAVQLGLAEAEWYQTSVPRDQLRRLLERRDGPALRDTVIWFALLGVTAWATIALWPSWWAVLPYLLYTVLYATASDSRWHEAGHGTAFKTDWMNNALYEIASFMVMRESVVWRWSHTRHHSDTVIVGRDPEIQVSRPPDLRAHVASIFNLGSYRNYFPQLVRHALGRMSADERTYIPETQFPKIYRNARIILALHLVVVALCFVLRTPLPAFFIILPHFFGNWLMILHNTTQHAGLAENVLDHRLNCRTVYMNPFSRFVYWNMNYHLEHHMFPLVPYHALPRLHELIKHDCPPPYPSILAAWREILPAVLMQVKDPAYHVKRVLPAPRSRHPGRRRLARDLRRRRPRPGGRHPLRPREKNLRPLPRRRRQTLRDRRHLHPRQHSPLRRPREGQNHRVPQAQRPLQPRRRIPCPRPHLPRPRYLPARGTTRPPLAQLGPLRRLRCTRREDLSPAGRFQP